MREQPQIKLDNCSLTLSSELFSIFVPRTAAALRRMFSSPYTTGRQTEKISGDRCARAMTSGPTPAGSPMVTAIFGSLVLRFIYNTISYPHHVRTATPEGPPEAKSPPDVGYRIRRRIRGMGHLASQSAFPCFPGVRGIFSHCRWCYVPPLPDDPGRPLAEVHARGSF